MYAFFTVVRSYSLVPCRSGIASFQRRFTHPRSLVLIVSAFYQQAESELCASCMYVLRCLKSGTLLEAVSVLETCRLRMKARRRTLTTGVVCVGVDRGCSGCTCTPRAEEKIRRNSQGKFVIAPHHVKCTPQAEQESIFRTFLLC